jgi:uncharacterized protein YjdB
MKTTVFMLCVIIVAACEEGGPLPPCNGTVQVDDAPINLTIGDSTRVVARVSPLGACGNSSKRVEWAAAQPFVELRTVNDTTIQIKALSAGTTMLRVRSLVFSGRDSVQVTTAP